MQPNLIHSSQNALMHTLKMKVSVGSRFHQTGKVHVSEAIAVAENFYETFECNADKNRHATMKRNGLANTALFFHPSSKAGFIDWILLANEGFLPPAEVNPFKDQSKAEQLHYLDDYYCLEHVQRPGPQSPVGGRPDVRLDRRWLLLRRLHRLGPSLWDR